MGVYSSPTIEYRIRCVGNELMRVHFKPKTNLGKWSAWLIVAFAVCLGTFAAIFISQRSGGGTLLVNMGMAIGMIRAMPLAIAAFITGLISIGRMKERSIAVYLAVIFGLTALVFWILLWGI